MARDLGYVWIMRDFDVIPCSVTAFSAEHLAMHAAERIVGNRAVAVSGNCMLYGPGDGDTRLMIERCTREVALRVFPDLVLPVDGSF